MNSFGIDSTFIDDENIISKLNVLIKIERMDQYAPTSEIALTDRIKQSLQYIPQDLRKYALALFANTVYFPRVFSISVFKHLLNSLLFRYQLTDKDDIGKKCLVLEQDPTGIVNDFLRTNKIAGRLDKEKFPRLQQVKQFVEEANKHLAGETVENAELIEGFLKREYWVVLVDNSLSGKSLLSDLKLLIKLSEKYTTKPKKIILLVRTLTKFAYMRIKETYKDEIADKFLEMYYGLFLDERFIISDDEKQGERCKLFNKIGTYKGVVDTCKWLTEQSWYINDKTYDDHKKNSTADHSMTFGFEKIGITFVSSENCPSDSLPLLWYQNNEHYIPPFPRVPSRV